MPRHLFRGLLPVLGRTNDGRSFTSCDEEVSLTWDNFGDIEMLGDYLGGNPVSCCCQ
jgi:hypothetical protein